MYGMGTVINLLLKVQEKMHKSIINNEIQAD